MSDYFDLLGRQQRSAKPVSGDMLEYYGKVAADFYRSGRVPNLSKGVVEVVKTAALSPEQVRRVVEFANHDHYIYEHRKLSGAHRIVDFGNVIADPAAVLQDLNDGGNTPAPTSDFSQLDYHRPPMRKEASGLPFDLAAIEVPEERVDHTATLRELRSKLASAREKLDYERDRVKRAYDATLTEFVDNVKQALLDGATMGDVAAAVVAGGANRHGIRDVMPKLGSALLTTRTFRDPLELAESFEKRASTGIPRMEHPVIKEFQALQDLGAKLAQLDAARVYLFEREEKITHFLKHANKDGVIPRIYHAASRVADHAAPKAEGLTRALLGSGSPHAKDVAKVVHFGVKHAPTAAILIGANEVRRSLGSSPVVQKVMSTVPGTQAYDQRDMMLALQNQNQGYY